MSSPPARNGGGPARPSARRSGPPPVRSAATTWPRSPTPGPDQVGAGQAQHRQQLGDHDVGAAVSAGDDVGHRSRVAGAPRRGEEVGRSGQLEAGRADEAGARLPDQPADLAAPAGCLDRHDSPPVDGEEADRAAQPPGHGSRGQHRDGVVVGRLAPASDDSVGSTAVHAPSGTTWHATSPRRTHVDTGPVSPLTRSSPRASCAGCHGTLTWRGCPSRWGRRSPGGRARRRPAARARPP